VGQFSIGDPDQFCTGGYIDWEGKFREKFELQMKEKFDTHLYVGTMAQHPKNLDNRRVVLPAKAMKLRHAAALALVAPLC